MKNKVIKIDCYMLDLASPIIRMPSGHLHV